jgi:hypothetical protein
MSFTRFDYADFDVCGASVNSSTLVLPALQSEVTATPCAVKCYHLACAPAAYQTGAFSTIRNRLIDAVVDNLTNSGAPFGPGDWSNAHQWLNVSIPAGQSATFASALGCEQKVPCCDVASSATYCVAKPGTNGQPAWGSSRLFTGSTSELRVRNGLSGSTPIVILGTPPGVCTLVPGIGSVAVLPISTTFTMPAFDAARQSSLCLPIGGNANLCGAQFNLQAFFGDAGAAGGIAHTDGVTFTIGGL